MRVCIATGIFPPDKGGPAQFSFSYAAWLVDKGNDVVILSLTDKATEITRQDNPKRILHSRSARLPIRFIRTICSLRNISKNHVILANGLFLEILLTTYFCTMKYVAKVPGDIVWERARNRGETSLSIDDYQGKEKASKRLMRWFFTQSLRKAKLVIAPSEHMKDLIVRWGIDPEKISLVRNSVDINTFTPNYSAEKKFDLITICRLTQWKGVEEIIREAAAKKLSVGIVGSGPEEAKLRTLADGLGVNATFLGEIQQGELPLLLNQSRVFVLNSTYEGSPHALLEAMSCGAISIARASTGTVEVIADGINGFLCGDERSLGASIDRALSEAANRHEISKQARATIVDKNNRDENFAEITSLLRSVL
jgi:glycosyltransferase involved in cell wall biosynthesis